MYKFVTSDGKEFKTLNSRDYFSNYSVNTIIAVSESTIIRAVPDDFIGLSTEIDYRLDTFLKNVSTYPRITQLFRNLKPSIVRFGGTGCDHPGGAYWDPDGTYHFGGDKWYYGTITKEFVDMVFNFLASIGWKAIWQINLGSNNPTLFADEANYVYTKWSNRLVGIHIGNEPEGYVANGDRPSGWGYSEYKPEWESYHTAIRALNTSIPLAGTDSYSYTWVKGFTADEYTHLTYVSQHYYPTSAVGSGFSAPTIVNLLSSTLADRTLTSLKTWVSGAASYGLQVSLSESNSTSNSGTAGVSDVFASALWAVDYMFTALEQGIKNINFHGFNVTVVYSIFQPTGIPNPIYYALLLYCYAAPNGNSVASRTMSDCNVKSYSIVGADGKLRVVIVNKDLVTDSKIKINPSQNYTSAGAIFMQATDVTSTDVTLGGTTVSETDGTWDVGPLVSVPIVNGSAYLTVPKASAAVVTFTF